MSTTRLNLALAIAIGLSALTLLSLTEDRWFLGWLAAMLAASVAIGALARAARVPDALARILQLIPGPVAVWWLWEFWPELIIDTAEHVAVSFAPMAAHDGFRVLSVAVLWLLFIVAETIAAGLDRPGWTFPVLMLPYLVPALVLSEETPPGYLALCCAGYLLVLATAVYNRAAPDLMGGRRRLARGIALTGALVGVVAWTISSLVAVSIPERGSAVIDPGAGSNSVQLGDPTLDLVRNLRSPTGRQIISYSSSDGAGHYLRLVALPAFDRSGFRLVPTDLVQGVPSVPTGIATQPVELAVEVGDFRSEWLPVPWIPQVFDADGDWRHDPATDAIVAVGTNRSLATRNLTYQVTADLPQPSQEEIATADAGDPRDAGITLGLPDELDADIIELAHQVTADAATAGEQTLALAGWLRSEAFTYSTAVVDGSTLDTVSDFLLVSRTGYCEQFAGSLAILTRALGIPSRVVVGFLPGTATEDGYEVSTKDMHAWTEVFLDGLGWVALDPTPSGAPGAAPIPSPSPSPSTATPSADPEIDDLPPSSVPPTTAPPAEAGDGSSGFQLPDWTGWAIAAVVLALLPAMVRQFRSWSRLRPGADPADATENAWDELRDVVLDLGRPWPEGTPRQIAAEIAGWLDPVAAATVTALGQQVERARFAPAEAADRAVDPRQLRLVTDALAAASSHHLLGRLFPRSVFQ